MFEPTENTMSAISAVDVERTRTKREHQQGPMKEAFGF
jgi:hypothetical protein